MKNNGLSLKNNGGTAGFITLSWSGQTDSIFTLQSFKQGGWVTLYEGRDTATTLTGLSNGVYLYRVKEQNGAWSQPLKVIIQHHPLWKAFAFFTLGLVLIIILCGLLFSRSSLKKVKGETDE